MNKIDELKFNVEALFHAVEEDKELFTPIYRFVEKLHDLLTINIHDAKKEEINFFSDKIEEFFKKYSYSGDLPILLPGGILQNNKKVKEISHISKELTELSDDDLKNLNHHQMLSPKQIMKRNIKRYLSAMAEVNCGQDYKYL